MNDSLDWGTKIEKLAAEPEAFLMHKSRNFLLKIQNQREFSKKMNEKD